MKEKEVLKGCLDYLRLRKILHFRHNNISVFKNNTYIAFNGTYGVPDIIAILPNGKFLGIECKSTIGKQNPNQILFEKQCKASNGEYIVVRSVNDLIDFLSRFSQG